MINVLVFPCGSEISMEIFQSLKNIRFINLYGGSSIDDHGRFVYKNYINGLPYYNDSNFVDKLNVIIDYYKIDYLFPAHDDVVLLCAKEADKLHAKVVTSDYETADICRHKKKTYDFFKDAYFNPVVYSSVEDVDKFPMIIKPDVGQGSYGVKKIESGTELIEAIAAAREEMVLVEYLPGEEFTIDCFTDKNHVLRFCSIRVRQRTKSGISVCSSIRPMNAQVKEIANIINTRFQMRGMWFFQLKKNELGEYKLLEIAPRVAGTMCVQRAIGVNLPLLAIYDLMGKEINCNPVIDEILVDRALINRYEVLREYNRVIVDYDDTIIINDKVNIQMMMFLYQCKNNRIPVIVLTKHLGNLEEDFFKHGISQALFTEIIQILPGEEKKDSIVAGYEDLFIDDSFSEREKMKKKYNVMAFGVDMVEVLLDWRM